MVLTPEEARADLEERAERLRQRVSELDGELVQYADTLPRVTLIETEYLRAVAAAELIWVEGVVEDLRSGVLRWRDEDFEAARSDAQD